MAVIAPVALVWLSTCSSAKPLGSRTRAISAASWWGVALVSSHATLGRITSPQISRTKPVPSVLTAEVLLGVMRPVLRSHRTTSCLQSALPSASAPLAIQRSCQLWPGCASSHSSVLIKPNPRWC